MKWVYYMILNGFITPESYPQCPHVGQEICLLLPSQFEKERSVLIRPSHTERCGREGSKEGERGKGREQVERLVLIGVSSLSWSLCLNTSLYVSVSLDLSLPPYLSPTLPLSLYLLPSLCPPVSLSPISKPLKKHTVLGSCRRRP